jgi:hypothetical protein
MWLYVIGGDSGPLKIGYSGNPKARVRDLNISSPVQLEIKHTREVAGLTCKFTEKYAHALLASRWVKGEWFDVTPDQAIAAIRLADEGVSAGRLPPGPSVQNATGATTQSSGVPFGVSSMTPQRAVAARRYGYLLEAASRRGRDIEPLMDARRKLDRIHDDVRRECGAIGLTLLERVVGVGDSIATLPGSYRQYHIMRRFVFSALDRVFRLTSD